MLSSKDYNLITNWKRRGVPVEIVLRGIRNAVQSCGKEKNDAFPLSLSHFADSVEKEIAAYRRAKKDKSAVFKLNENEFIARLAQRLADIIKSEKRENIRRRYIAVRRRIMSLAGLKGADVFRKLDRLEDEFYESFFQSLPEAEKEGVKLKAENMIAGRIRFMTDRARQESLLSFRNEIIRKDYKLASVVSDD